MRNTTVFRGAVLSAALISVTACSSGPEAEKGPGTTNPPTTNPPGKIPTTGGDPHQGVFESAHPSGSNATRSNEGAVGAPGLSPAVPGAGATGGGDAVGEPTPGATPSPNAPVNPVAPTATTPPPSVPDEGPSEGPERAIEEADVIKRDGDRLYALSTIGGLTVVDLSDPDDLELLGRFRATATPFEMYVRGDTVFVLYNGYAEYAYDDETGQYTYYQTSYVVALDVSDPKAIRESQRFEIPGYIADSRLVGDALYVVAYDDSYCYHCGDTPQTHVLSLNVSEPTDIVKVDQIDFDERVDGYGWGRSLSGNDKRLYVAGPRYGSGAEPAGSTIQVIDISDASGDLRPGAALEVAGQINSRWQMDEFEGVLRVVSQPLTWAQVTVPAVETFEIVSSDEFEPLGAVDLVLPRPEQLQAVRFDGLRGYAITFEQTDPLFTIDLSDPANPVQTGELEMPGWVYHMEPRGDRLIGLGFDQGNPDGALTVSLFDVSDLATPTMIDRVNFGGAWADLAEDQDRIHKSFQVLDADELVLVPYSGYDYSGDQCTGYGAYVSGVQLIQLTEDDLTLAGVAPSRGAARRALLHKERLLTMSDERLESFDIDDRNAPVAASKVDLAQIVNQVQVAGDSIVRIGSSYWSNGQGLEVTVSDLEGLVRLEPGATLAFDDINTRTCDGETYLQAVLSGQGRAYFQYQKYDYNSGKTDTTRVKVLDVSDPARPEVAGDADLGFSPQGGYTSVPGMVNNGSNSLALGSALAFTNHRIEYNNLGFIVKNESTLEVFDFSDPSEPARTSIQMPASLGSTGLLASGETIATSHFEAVPDNVDAVRFYLDRVDVSDASAPAVLAPVNIPGSLLAYDADRERALTIDYQYVNVENISPKQCYEVEFGTFLTDNPTRVDWETSRGACSALRFTLHLVDVAGEHAAIVDSYPVDKGVYISAAALGEDRVFLGTAASSGGYYVDGGVPAPALPPSAAPSWGGLGSIGYGYYPVTVGSAKLLVASGLGDDTLQVAPIELETTDRFYGFSSILAKGKKAVVATGWYNQMSVIDATNAAQPVVADSIELAGYVSDLDLVGNTAVAALGPAGVQTLSLGE